MALLGSYMRGTTIAFGVTFKNKRTGSAIEPDADTISLKTYKDGSLIHTAPPGDISSLGSGQYEYLWDTEPTLAVGIYVYIWEAEYNGKDVGNDGLFRIRKRKRE